jgi:pimeloyl-ACP methyl ester carboxylesterase
MSTKHSPSRTAPREQYEQTKPKAKQKSGSKLYLLLMLISLFTQFAAAQTAPALPPKGFKSARLKVNGTSIHYMIGGKGKPLLLLHGFAQNWYAWNRLLPALANHFQLIVPDLRGIGESGRPKTGYDKKTMAADIHALSEKLNLGTIYLAGHDIGMMVAYSYARQYPRQVERLALLDTPVAGIEPVWTQSKIFSWWWGFHSWPQSEQLLAGREAQYMKGFWGMVSHQKQPFNATERQEFIRANTKNGAFGLSLKYFATFDQDARENLRYTSKLKMPVLAIGGEYSVPTMADDMASVAEQVSGVIIPGSGHWVVQENSPAVQQAFLDFFAR